MEFHLLQTSFPYRPDCTVSKLDIGFYNRDGDTTWKSDNYLPRWCCAEVVL
jgi:hypothetical protein